MLSVNDLIQNAYTRTGLVGDSQSVNGTRAKTAQMELNALIQELNTQEYIADNIRIYDVDVKSTIVIADAVDADIKIKNVPSHIKSVARKIGNRFTPLYTSNLEAIHSNSNCHLSTQFTYNVSYDPEIIVSKVLKENCYVVNAVSDLPEATVVGLNAYVKDVDYMYVTVGGHHGMPMWVPTQQHPIQEMIDELYNIEKGTMVGTITLDTNTSGSYKVMFIEPIPEYDLTDKIFLQDMYLNMLLAGLSYKLAIRYKVKDWVSVFKEEYEDQMSLVKRTNQSNRKMVWADLNDGSYMDSYYNGVNGFGW